eukprot:g13750.t1
MVEVSVGGHRRLLGVHPEYLKVQLRHNKDGGGGSSSSSSSSSSRSSSSSSSSSSRGAVQSSLFEQQREEYDREAEQREEEEEEEEEEEAAIHDRHGAGLGHPHTLPSFYGMPATTAQREAISCASRQEFPLSSSAGEAGRGEGMTGSTSRRRNRWTPDEDTALMRLVEQYGAKRWAEISLHLPERSGNQCRERWHNHLHPDVRKDAWTPEEDSLLFETQVQLGNQWATISQLFPGRTDNAVKNRYYSAIRRRQRHVDSQGRGAANFTATEESDGLPGIVPAPGAAVASAAGGAAGSAGAGGFGAHPCRALRTPVNQSELTAPHDCAGDAQPQMAKSAQTKAHAAANALAVGPVTEPEGDGLASENAEEGEERRASPPVKRPRLDAQAAKVAAATAEAGAGSAGPAAQRPLVIEPVAREPRVQAAAAVVQEGNREGGAQENIVAAALAPAEAPEIAEEEEEEEHEEGQEDGACGVAAAREASNNARRDKSANGATPRIGALYQADLPPLLGQESLSPGRVAYFENRRCWPGGEEPLTSDDEDGGGDDDDADTEDLLMSAHDYHMLLTRDMDTHNNVVEGESHAERARRYREQVDAMPKKDPSSARPWSKKDAARFEEAVHVCEGDFHKIQGWLPYKGVDEIEARYSLYRTWKSRKKDVSTSKAYKNRRSEIRARAEPKVNRMQMFSLLAGVELNLSPTGFHPKCAGLAKVPKGVWFCWKCESQVAILKDKVACYERAIAADATGNA